MIPIRDTIPCLHKPVLTWALIFVNVAIFLLLITLPEQIVSRSFYIYGMVPARFTHPEWALRYGLEWNTYGSMLTSMFLHGGWLHIIFNMWMLWIFGDNIEDRMGAARYLGFYLLCGVIAGVMQLVSMPESTVPIVGASGAIAGILGAYFFMYPYASIVIWVPVFFLPLFVQVPAVVFLGLWVIIQLFSGTLSIAQNDAYADVAWWGHLGGFIAGALLHRWFLRPPAA